MQRWMSGLRHAIAPIAILAVAGCTGSPIGDPCVPESIPGGGFDPREIYLETSSVQCRTRVCMVYQLDGNPEHVNEDGTCPAGASDCVSASALESQVFCSCRCQVPGDQDATGLCDCGDGYTCIDDVVTTGGEGVRGGYCVPCIRPDGDTRNLDSAIFSECPVES